MATVRRIYGGFRGVDFRGEEISLQRSPDSLNMWRCYKTAQGIRTRPGLSLHTAFSQPVYGIYGFGSDLLVHSGEKLYRLTGKEAQVLGEGLKAGRSCGFSYGEKWYFLDGAHYLCYDGQTLAPVEGYIPTTTIGRAPAGSGTVLEDVNLLSDYRINTFLGDGESKVFHLDAENIDKDFLPVVTADGKAVTVSAADWEKGIVTLAEAPKKPATVGQDNVTIKFKRHIPGNREKILGCTMVQAFDNRVFFTGNPQYPNTLWHSSLQDPSYFSDLDYYREGLDNAPITGMTAGNNALWVFRAPGNAGTHVFYHTPVLDADYGKIYPSVHSSVAVGCVGKAVNFLDDMVFFSPRGMEGISGDITTEQGVTHRSSLVDRKLLAEPGYRDMLLEEWEGYLLIFVGDKVYLADSRQVFTHEGHREYEFYYWQLEKAPISTRVQEGVLYLGMDDGVYTLEEGVAVPSWWTTPLDKFAQPGRWKTLDGQPAVAEAQGKRLEVSAKAGGEDRWTSVGIFDDVADAAVFRVKKKKFKDLRLKFSSPKGFSLETVTVTAQVGAPIKRV
ncbi:MAG: hypothetical protein IJA45_09475 [Oscillospiraceae bacterium]|nr:hypothetical protein [Oscillospiraceae bacterium]